MDRMVTTLRELKGPEEMSTDGNSAIHPKVWGADPTEGGDGGVTQVYNRSATRRLNCRVPFPTPTTTSSSSSAVCPADWRFNLSILNQRSAQLGDVSQGWSLELKTGQFSKNQFSKLGFPAPFLTGKADHLVLAHSPTLRSGIRSISGMTQGPLLTVVWPVCLPLTCCPVTPHEATALYT